MAAAVNWDRLRELAGFRAEKGCAVSLYLNLDPRDTPTIGDAQSRVHSLLDQAGRATDRAELGHDQRVALMFGELGWGGPHLTRGIGGVSGVDILQDERGRDLAIRIAHGAGQTLLTFAQ